MQYAKCTVYDGIILYITLLMSVIIFAKLMDNSVMRGMTCALPLGNGHLRLFQGDRKAVIAVRSVGGDTLALYPSSAATLMCVNVHSCYFLCQHATFRTDSKKYCNKKINKYISKGAKIMYSSKRKLVKNKHRSKRLIIEEMYNA